MDAADVSDSTEIDPTPSCVDGTADVADGDRNEMNVTAEGKSPAAEINGLLEVWELQCDNADYDPVPTLTRCAELVEASTSAFLKLNADPFDDRHPAKVDADAPLGGVLKAIFNNEEFVSKIVISYLLRRDNPRLCTVAARLLLGCAPGLDAQVVFQETDDLIPTLYGWLRESEEPLQSYATGLLGVAMETSEISAQYRDENHAVIPLLLQRLTRLQTADTQRRRDDAPFAHLANETFNVGDTRPTLAEVLRVRLDNTPIGDEPQQPCSSSAATSKGDDSTAAATSKGDDVLARLLPCVMADSPIRVASVPRKQPPTAMLVPGQGAPASPPPYKRQRLDETASWRDDGGGSRSSWMELERLVIGTHSLHPMTDVMRQRLILQFLAPVSEYQDLLVHAFSYNVLEVIFGYIDLCCNQDVRLAYDALRYLASLLVHRKFAIEFVQKRGVEKLLSVYRHSMASTGVALCLYYLGYNKDIMEKVCQQLTHDTLDQLIDYALYLLEHSYESGKCHATMFFIYAFAFRPVVDLFDRKDGLRKLVNYISTLSLLQIDDEERQLDDDQLYQSRQAVRNVCAAFRR